MVVNSHRRPPLSWTYEWRMCIVLEEEVDITQTKAQYHKKVLDRRIGLKIHRTMQREICWGSQVV